MLVENKIKIVIFINTMHWLFCAFISSQGGGKKSMRVFFLYIPDDIT